MADKLTPSARSRNMSRIRSKHTVPELVVRCYLHKKGLRYRLHAPGLPGKPDLVFMSRRVCVFVHGCFWHGCTKCVDGTRSVKSNHVYWGPKIEANKVRDVKHAAALRQSGWKVLTVWECETRDMKRLAYLFRAIAKSPTTA